jgi:DNA-binding GntR family transcriptional regulator
MAIERIPFSNSDDLQDPLVGVTSSTRSTIPQLVAGELRAAIIDGTLSPGQPLRQDAVARHFSTSAIPVREAFRQLETEGWIVVEPNKGATVSPLSADEAREIYEIRAALESLALELAMPHYTESSLAATETLLKAATDESEQLLYVLRNEEFHMSLYRPSGRPRLMRMIDSMYRRGERYLRLKFGLPSVKRESDTEHVAIFEAVCRRDIVGAKTLLAEHLFNTGDLLYEFLTGTGKDTPDQAVIRAKSRLSHQSDRKRNTGRA